MLNDKNQHLVELLTMVRSINRVIINQKDAGGLIDGVCKTLVHSKQFTSAWIVLIENEESYAIASQAGIGSMYDQFKAKIKKGHFPKCFEQVLRSKKLMTVCGNEEFCNECSGSKKNEDCTFITPLLHEEKLYGTLAISVIMESIIETYEKRIISEVGEDLAFALHTIEEADKKKSREDNLIKNKFLLDTLMENLPINVYFKNKESEFIRVSKNMADYFEKTDPSEFVGKTDYDIWPSTHAKRAMDDEKQIIETLKPIIEDEEKHLNEDGSEKWLSTSKLPILGKSGDAIGTFGISRDITVEKMAKESIRQSREMFLKMGMGALDAIIMINHEGKVEFWNPAAEKMFGYSEKEIKHQLVHDFIMPQKYSKLQKRNWTRYEKTGEGNAIGHVVELEAVHKNGTEFPVEIALSKLTIDGKFWALASIRDISERKRAEQLAKENNTILQNMSKNVPGMIYQFKINSEGKNIFTYCSDGVQEMFGLTSTELKEDGQRLFDLIIDEDQSKMRRSLIVSAHRKVNWRLDFRVYNEHIGLKWIKGEATPESIEDGSVVWYGYMFDYTEQREINENLRLKNEQFELVVHGSNDGIWDWNIKTNELFLSPRWKNQLGYTDEEIENTLESFESLLHPEDKERVMKNLNLYLEGKTGVYDIVFRMKRKTGVYMWINAKGEAVRENNVPVRMAGSHSDVTEQVHASKILESAFERTRAIMNSVQSGIILVRKSDRIIVDANPAVEKILGVNKEKVIGQVCNKYICPSDMGQCPIIDKGKELKNADCWAKTTNDELIPILKNVSELELDGEPHFIESFVDIRRQKEIEKELRKAKEEADHANKAKSEFLANMSHEIRTPMNSILGFSEVLLNSTMNEKHKGYISTILSSGRTLLSLINDILDLSKIEAGKLEVEMKPFNIYETVAEMKQLFDQKVREKNLNFIVEVEDGFPGTIYLDEIRIRQVLLNLIGNAIKFTSAGFIKVELKQKQRTEEHIDFRVSIEDSGIGISEEFIKEIFESFSQETSDSTREFEGTGLGLAISKRLCELMNGTIRVSSELGKGSQFNIDFEQIQFSEYAIDKKDSFEWTQDEIEFENSKVLIVDDVTFNRDLIQSYCEAFKLEIVEAENGQDAVDKARDFHPDLIFMDIKMPVLDGYGATELLRKDETLKFIPIVALTASTMSDETQKINRLFNGYIRKPVQRNSLVESLVNFLPHRIIKAEVGQVSGAEKMEKPEDVSAEIKQEFIDQFKVRIIGFQVAMVVDEFDAFLEELMEFAQTHNLKYLKARHTVLSNYVEQFEFGGINAELKDILNFFETE